MSERVQTDGVVAVRATARVIWETMQKLREDGQIISRQRLMELTGLTFTKIDDHVSRWVDSGRLRRVVDGVYELVGAIPEPRAVSVTDLHDGQTLIEVGDQQMRLWPTETRALGLRLTGNAMQFAQLQTQHDMGVLVAEMTVRYRAMANRVADLEHEKRMARQESVTRVRMAGADAGANDGPSKSVSSAETAGVG